MLHMKRYAACVALLLLAGCGGGSTPVSAPVPSPTTVATLNPVPQPSPGRPAFMAAVKASGFGDKDPTDPGFLGLANVLCSGATSGYSYGDLIASLDDTEAHATPAQEEAFIRAAITNLCPEHKDLLP